MTGIQALGVLIIRLWAVGAIFGSISPFVSLLGYDLENHVERRYFLSSAIDGGVWFALGLAAWVLAPTLAKRTVPAWVEGNLTISIGVVEFVAIGSFLIGGFYIVNYLPASVANLAVIYHQMANDASYLSDNKDPQALRSLVGDLLRLAIAVVLTFRPRDVANMFATLRVAGLSKNVTQDTPPETA